MRYVNAAQAARMLGIGDKTIRRWLKEGKKLPGAIVKANGEYAIPENEVEELKQLRSKFATTQEEKLTSHDHTGVSLLAEKLAALEQEVAELRKGQSLSSQQNEKPSINTPTINAISQSASSQTRNVEPRRAYNRKKNTGLPDGCILATEFAANHGIARETFRDHQNTGLGPGLIHGPDIPEDGSVKVKDYVRSEERNKRVRKDGTIEKERYLTSDQQAVAIQFWKRHSVDYSECEQDGCFCHTLKQENN